MPGTKTYTQDELKALSRRLESSDPEAIVRWAVGEFFPDLTLACSFGGPSGMALLDLVAKVEPRVDVFYLDTGFLFPETYETVRVAAERYGIEPVAYRPLLTPEEQAAQYGEALWARDPDLCCELRKVEPNRRALTGKRAWISGLRRDQSKTREAIDIVEWDHQFGLVKVNPLAAWTERDVWAYIVAHGVPYNPLHDRSYPSIGCTHCTSPVKPGDDLRSGRWQGFDKTECGIQLGSAGIAERTGASGAPRTTRNGGTTKA